MQKQSVFTSEIGKEKIRGYYNAILDAFPLGKRYVQTTFGQTFVLEAGNKERDPMVLLHGSCSNSAAWLGDMAPLSSAYHVLALDIPGEPGNSEEYRLDVQSDAYIQWLKEVLDALAIKKAIIMGNSLGGWLALHFAVAHPERVQALILLAASGIVAPNQEFIRQTEQIPTDRSNAKTVGDTILGESVLPKEVLQFMALVYEYFNPIVGALPVVPSDRLGSLTMPVLFIAGRQDTTMDVSQAAKHLTKHVSQAKVMLLEGSHVITSAANHVLPFLAERVQHKGW